MQKHHPETNPSRPLKHNRSKKQARPFTVAPYALQMSARFAFGSLFDFVFSGLLFAFLGISAFLVGGVVYEYVVKFTVAVVCVAFAVVVEIAFTSLFEAAFTPLGPSFEGAFTFFVLRYLGNGLAVVAQLIEGVGDILGL